MPDLGLSVTVSRAALGLPPLELNDHTNYYIATQLLGGNIVWNRNSVTSPFVDGGVTTFRTRQVLNEQITVEVLAGTVAELHTNLDQLVAAVTQDSYHLNVTVDGEPFAYACEAADYQVVWNGPRVIAKQVQVQLTIPRQPVPLSGIV